MPANHLWLLNSARNTRQLTFSTPLSQVCSVGLPSSFGRRRELPGHGHEFEPCHPEDPFNKPAEKLGDWQYDKHEEFKKAGLLALIGIGAEPGISNIFAATPQITCLVKLMTSQFGWRKPGCDKRRR